MTNEEAMAFARALDTNPAAYPHLLAGFAEICNAHAALFTRSE